MPSSQERPHDFGALLNSGRRRSSNTFQNQPRPSFDANENEEDGNDSELEPPTLLGLTRQNAIQPISVSSQ